MANLYHNDIYKFEKPINSYWESTIDKRDKYKTIEKDMNTNVVVIGGGYTGISCALSLAKKFNEDVVVLEAGAKAKVTLALDSRSFSVWDVAASGWRIVSGEFKVMVGASSRDIRLRGTVGAPSVERS